MKRKRQTGNDKWEDSQAVDAPADTDVLRSGPQGPHAAAALGSRVGGMPSERQMGKCKTGFNFCQFPIASW